MDDCLTWDDTFPIAKALIQIHPGLDLHDVSLEMIFRWTIQLPQFCDEPSLANDGILAAIYQEWFEEVNPV